MGNYSAPGVYIEDVKSGSHSIAQIDGSVCAVAGVTRSGASGKAQLVNSWQEFVTKFANGLDTPYTENSLLTYAVQGFYANNSKGKLYVARVLPSEGAAIASKTGNSLKVTAHSEGEWGNQLTLKVKHNEDYSEAEDSKNLVFDVEIILGSSSSTLVTGVYKDTIEAKVLSNPTARFWIGDIEVTGEELTEEEITLEGGTDGTENIKDADYVNALSMFDEFVPEITLVSIPGIETTAVRRGVLDYCEANKLFPVISMPVGSFNEDVKSYRKTVSSTYGALVYPWVVVTDPLTNREKTVPPEGHYMGVCSRVINERGVWKAPAGTEAVIRGINSLEFSLTPADSSFLNPLGVVCLLTRRNYGMVVWGARGLNSTDDKMRYVSDHFMNINIRKSLYEGTQFAVFEPNTEMLWKCIYTTCRNFFEGLRTKGALKGSGEGTSWYVVVDETNNTDETMDNGELNIEIGYAPVKPAEFVIIKLAHSIDVAE